MIGTLSLDEALSERERINIDVQQQMEAVTDKWGIRINRIEIVEITPPPQILQALALQKQADQEKRAKILQSEVLPRPPAVRVCDVHRGMPRPRTGRMCVLLFGLLLEGEGLEDLGRRGDLDDLDPVDPGRPTCP